MKAKTKRTRAMLTYLAAIRAHISARRQELGPIYESGRLVDASYLLLSDEEKEAVDAMPSYKRQ